MSSQLALQSSKSGVEYMLRLTDLQVDLLEQDSEMQRAMGDVLNSESEGMI